MAGDVEICRTHFALFVTVHRIEAFRHTIDQPQALNAASALQLRT